MAHEAGESSGYHAARGTLYLLTKSIVFSCVGAILYIVIARTLPATSDLGLFQGVQSLISMAVVVAGAGIARAAIRVISFDIGAGNIKKAESTYPTVFAIGIIISVATSLIVFVLGGLIARTFFHDISYSLLIQVSSIDVFLLTMIIYSTSLLYAMQRFRTAFLISIVNITLKLVISILLLLAISSVLYVIVAFVISDAISLALFITPIMPKLRYKPLPYKEFMGLLKFSSPLYGSSILDYLAKEMDIYVLLLLSSLSIVGLYGPAVLIGTVLFWTLAALDQAFAPYFPRVFGKDGLNSLQQLSRLTSRYLFLVYIPLCFLVLASIPEVLPLLLGEKYVASVYPALIIVLTITFTSMIVIFNNMLMSTGHSRIFLVASVIALGVQLSISLLLIPLIGGLGAALARSSSYIILFLCPALLLRRISGLHYDLAALKTGLVGSVIILAVVWFLNEFLPDRRFLPLNIGLAIISYLVFLRFSRTVVPKDFEIMNNIFSNKGARLIEWVSRFVIRS